MENNLIKLTIKNDIEGVKKLIADGADINIQSNEGDTALIIASYRGYTEIVKILFEEGADINIQSNEGDTALTDAEKQGHVEIVKILKEPRNYHEIRSKLIKRLTEKFEKKEQELLAKFEKKEQELTKILEEKEGKLLAGFQTKFNGLQYRNLNDLQSAKFISDYEKRIICGLLPMPITKINN